MELANLVPAMTAIRRVIRAPLFSFIILGLAMFAVDSMLRGKADNTITVSSSDTQQIHAQWRAQTGQELSAQMLRTLTDELVDERRLAREAVALGLDRDDVIIRRRLVQKMRFLVESVADTADPTNEDIRRYYDANLTAYAIPAKYSFRQIYFSSESRGDTAVVAARASLAEIDNLRVDDAEPDITGDSFFSGPTFSDQSSNALVLVFGNEFVEQIAAHDVGTWFGPISSSSGYHLVYLHSKTKEHFVALDRILDQVTLDLRAERRRNSFRQYLNDLAEKYPVTADGGEIKSLVDDRVASNQ